MKKFYNDGNIALPIRLTSEEAASYNFVYFDMVEYEEAVKAFFASTYLEERMVEYQEAVKVFFASTDLEERMVVYLTANRVKNRLDRRPGINKTRLRRLTPVK